MIEVPDSAPGGSAAQAELVADLRALREDVAACSPGVRSVIAVSGPDHVAWLDRISSMPVATLEPGRAVRATLMDGKGKLRADLTVMHLPAAPGQEQRLLLDVPASQHAALLRVLDMFILREKIALADLGASHRIVSVLGPRAEAALTAAGLPFPRDDQALSAGSVIAAVRSRLCGAPGADLVVPAAEAGPLLERLAGGGARPIGAAALEVERVAHGVPWFAAELASGVIPLEAGLDADVSVTKGCYPGQEVVARITNLGQVARRLLRLSTPGEHALAAGAALAGSGERAAQEAGQVTSAAFDPLAGRTLALAFLRRAFWKPGTIVRAGELPLEVAELHAH
jgi:folate-binding protein YgfZ